MSIQSTFSFPIYFKSYNFRVGFEVSFPQRVSEKHPQDVTRFKNKSTKSYGEVVSVVNNGKWSGFTPRPLYAKKRAPVNIVEEVG
jgi:hypothetical protein